MRSSIALMSSVMLLNCSPCAGTGEFVQSPVQQVAATPATPEPVAVRAASPAATPVEATSVLDAAGERTAKKSSGPFVVHVVDVGTGLGIFVEGPDFSLVYDAGSNDDFAGGAKNRFTAYLRAVKPQLTVLDHVVLSHPHKDHVELVSDVLESYSVGNFWDSGAETGECEYEKTISLVQTKKIAYRSATQDEGRRALSFAKTCSGNKPSYDLAFGPRIRTGTNVLLGKNASMTFLFADPKTEIDPNDNSLVVRLDLGTKRVLLMGDGGAGERAEPSKAPKAGSIEANLLANHKADIRADVLVVGHHGSRSASRMAFLDAVAAKTLIVSSGPKEYGGTRLPDVGVVEVLQKHGTLFRTDRDDDACKKNPRKIGTDADGKPGGCDNVIITFNGTDAPKAEYWSKAD